MGISDRGHRTQYLLPYDAQEPPPEPGNAVLRAARKWRLTILFVITSMAVIAAAAVFVSSAASDLAISNLKTSASEETAKIAMHLQDMFPNLSAATFTMDDRLYTPSGFDSLLDPDGTAGEVPRLLGAFNIVKLNIFDLTGKTVWSTDSENMGLTYSKSNLFQEASTGRVSSELVEDLNVAHLDGAIKRIDVMETYVPLIERSTGNTIGVLEVYRDVTLETRSKTPVLIR